MDYLDFELEIGERLGFEYPVQVMHSPAGEARGIMRFPFDQLAMKNYLKELQIALLPSKLCRVLLPEQTIVKQFGGMLFKVLFAGELLSCYDVSLSEANHCEKGLRLKFRILSPELGAIPWEFLYDERIDEYLSLSRNTPIIRYPELQQSIKRMTVKPPLRILGMISIPCELSSLNVKEEKQRIEEAFEALQRKGIVELRWLSGQTWRDLQHEMLSGPWHIFHYIGHGSFNQNTDEGFIVLADQQGHEHHLTAKELSRLLSDHVSLRLVLLNSCESARGSENDIFSSISTVLIRHGIPAVIAMQYKISDLAAIEFARSFYESLADHRLPVEAAISEARKAISIKIPCTLEWGIPVLYMRSPDGKLFDFESAPPIEIPNVKVDNSKTEPGLPYPPFRSRKKELSVNEVEIMLKEHNFYDADLNRNGKGFKNQFEIQTINGEKVIIDHASGLMWQKRGSSTFMSFEIAKAWVAELNQNKYAGFHNWRLPTLEEAMCLMKPKRNKADQHIDARFDNMQGSIKWIWTSDSIKGENRPWVVGFDLGECYHGPFAHHVYVRAVRSFKRMIEFTAR